jgi:hypothetical protein
MMNKGRNLAYFMSIVIIAGVISGFILSDVYNKISSDKKPVLELSEKTKTVGADTQMVYEREYLKCGHIITSEFEPDLTGKNLTQIRKKYSANEGYRITWQENTLVIHQQIDGFCPEDKEIYRLKEYQGMVAVYRGIKEAEVLERVTAIRMQLLPVAVQEDIRAGKFEFKDKNALNDALENFDEYL